MELHGYNWQHSALWHWTGHAALHLAKVQRLGKGDAKDRLYHSVPGNGIAILNGFAWNIHKGEVQGRLLLDGDQVSMSSKTT